jgi:hypothetical protein
MMSSFVAIHIKCRNLVFEPLIGGNLTVPLTKSLPNGTIVLNPEYNRNNDTFISLERELRPVLELNAKILLCILKTGTGSNEGKCTNLEGVMHIRNHS